MSGVILLAIRIVLAVLLYAFLGLVVYTQLRELRQQGTLLAARQPPPLVLSAPVEQGATEQLFTKPVVIVGREQGCDFRLDDPAVSLQHARLSFRQQQWWLEDLASTNGTYLNGEAVTAPVVVTHGDELRLGRNELKIGIGQIKNQPSG
jgi:hypothetical protein